MDIYVGNLSYDLTAEELREARLVIPADLLVAKKKHQVLGEGAVQFRDLGPGHVVDLVRREREALGNEERRPKAVLLEEGADVRVQRGDGIVEGQHHFLVLQEIELLEMLEAEAGASGRVDHDGAGHAECVGIGECERTRSDDQTGSQSFWWGTGGLV